MKRLNAIITDPGYLEHLEKIAAAEEDRLFCGHDFNHLLTVARITWMLLLENGSPHISREIAYTAGILHDLGRWQQYEDGRDHAETSVALAEPLLTRAGFSKPERELIMKAIGQHRGRPGDDEHVSPLGQALASADNFARTCFNCPARAECNKLEQQPHASGLEY